MKHLKLYSIGEIELECNAKKHQVQYILRRDRIEPVYRRPNVNLYSAEQLEHVRTALQEVRT